MKLIRHVKIYDYINFIDDGYVMFEDQIIECGPMTDLDLDNYRGVIIEGQGKLLMPGLINFHSHIYSTLVRGCAIPMNPVTFKDILNQLWWRFDAKLNNEASYSSALVFGLESIKAGVTSLIDHHASGLDIKGSLEELRAAICTELGMRGIFCFETSDRFDISQCIEENKQALSWQESDVGGMFGLHASLSLSDKTLQRVSEVLDNKPIHIHVGESIEDQLDAVNQYDMPVVERLFSHKLLNKNALLAHCIHITEKECEWIAEKGAFVVLNPTSNLNNAVGVFNIDNYRQHKIPVLIGTDGLGVNVGKEWTNLYYMGKGKLEDPVGISLEEVRKYMVQSYQYFGELLAIDIGRLAKGYVSDFMLLDYKAPTEMNDDNAFAHVFYGLMDQIKPSDVWIKGESVIRDYQSEFDEVGIYKQANVAAKALWERIGG